MYKLWSVTPRMWGTNRQSLNSDFTHLSQTTCFLSLPHFFLPLFHIYSWVKKQLWPVSVSMCAVTFFKASFSGEKRRRLMCDDDAMCTSATMSSYFLQKQIQLERFKLKSIFNSFLLTCWQVKQRKQTVSYVTRTSEANKPVGVTFGKTLSVETNNKFASSNVTQCFCRYC